MNRPLNLADSMADVGYARPVKASDEKPLEPLPLLDLAAMAATDPPERKWAVEGFIPRKEVTLFTGPGSAGKSLLGKQMAVSLAAGLPVLSLSTMQASALYVTCEDDADELHRRLRKLHSALGADMAALVGKLHVSCLRGRLGNELCTFDSNGRLQPSPTFNLLREMIINAAAKFVVLDNVAHLFPGNENDRGEVTAFCNLLNNLAMETDCTILLIAHPNKAGDSYSGSTAWLNAVRSQITLETPKDADGTVIDPDARVLTVGKANYARNGTKLEFRWHDWAFVLETDIPKHALESVKKTAQATRDNDIFLVCLDERNRQRRAVSEKSGANFAPAIFERMPEAKGITKQRLADALDRLFRIGEIERGPLWRDTAKGRNVEGLQRVKNNPQTPPPNGPQTHFPTDPKRA